MTFHELTTLEVAFGTAAKVASAVEAWVNEGGGTLEGAWSTDIGTLNRVFLLRGFETIEALHAERERALRSDNPFGCSEHLVSLNMDSYRSFDGLGPVKSGKLGPVYEIRTYRTKLNGLTPTMEKWQASMPEREAYSPLAAALYALDGAPRITHIWPYPSLEDRTKQRSQSVADGKWPPKGGPDWLTTNMESHIAFPLPFSPLT